MDRFIKYKGYSYEPLVYDEDDHWYISHLISPDKGQYFFARFTPYCFMSKVDFKNYIEAGCPDKPDGGYWASDSLRKAKKVDI